MATKVGAVIDQQARIEPALQAPSRNNAIVVTLGAGGECLGLHIEDEAMRVSGPQLASRIMLLNAWGRLHVKGAPADELAEFERLLDF